ncbi:MAG: prepilin-type N-terminal cleavage/methylation domain-containing protein [Syntrophaceae bacterium]|nr:prepilin-type N-terminal cleavage/methylation domain-containing protein [Syntrophaceae bacterium]
MKTRHNKIDYYRRRRSSCKHSNAFHSSRAFTSDMRGFSLVELVVILVIIGILMVIALPTWSYMVTKAKVSRAEADIRTLEKDVTAYLIDKGTLPPSGQPGLDAIGRSGLRDPWNRPYQYLNTTSGGTPYQGDLPIPLNEDHFDIYSVGQNGVSTLSLADASSEDDIIRAGDGGFVGLGIDYKIP